MPVKSLFDLATASCVKNLKGLESIGDYLPYKAVRHILLKIDSAHQLRQVELNSPQIQGETGEIWLKLIEKDFPLEYKTKAYKPQNPDKWYRVWEKYKKDHDTALQESEDKLKSALAGLRQDKEKNTSRIIDRKLLPRSVKLGGVKKMYSGHRDAHSNTLSFNAGSRTKTSNGASVMRKVRREVKEIATIHGALSRPSRGTARVSQVHKAPASMVNDYRRAAQPSYRSSALSPEPPSAMAEHEERATFLPESDEDEDAMFDDDMPKAPSKQAYNKTAPAQSASASMPKKNSSALGAAASSSASPSSSRPTKSATVTASNPVKRSSGILSNKFRGKITKVQPRSPSSSPPPRAVAKEAQRSGSSKSTQYLPRTRTTPPPVDASSVRSSPPPIEAFPPPMPSASLHRKRKAVDIFMRPKKRMG
ncbi:hypothetical protein QQS21_010976 [Conoideocrella luteorostrata]|uniref:Elongin-A n=1 Tax=Conoideocrella luteorostrata TaxID=1105319 RepID=A0AAJ0CDY7_9HYPO|nr:hypothetical protein QQS21_010976 [Conoideocrella luteorostrata]